MIEGADNRTRVDALDLFSELQMPSFGAIYRNRKKI